MRPPSRPVLILTRSLLADGPLAGRFPIGQFQHVGSIASRPYSAILSQHTSKPRAKRRHDVAQRCSKLRQRTSGARSSSQWEKAPYGVANTPKRSNTAPLLGVLFGATALAYLGSSLIPHVDVQDNPIKSSDGVDITDTDGKSFTSFPSPTLMLQILS